MAYSHSSYFLTWLCVYLTLVVAAVITDKEECKGKGCPGPLAHYADLNCTPVYGEDDNCCAVKYNCSHLNNKSKCYLNGHEYEIGQPIREEDKNPCDEHCICKAAMDGIASFQCTQVSCPIKPYMNRTCYPVKDPLECCTHKIMCVNSPEDKPICEVDGKKYPAGGLFTTADRPDLTCICLPGYNGQTDEPYCKEAHRLFGSSVNASYNFYKNCSPVYRHDIDRFINQKDAWSCDDYYYATGDFIIHNSTNTTTDDNDMCLFDNVTMHRYDELHQATVLNLCLKCVCDVPPIPTCRLKPKDECNIPNSFWESTDEKFNFTEFLEARGVFKDIYLFVNYHHL